MQMLMVQKEFIRAGVIKLSDDHMPSMLSLLLNFEKDTRIYILESICRKKSEF